MNMATIPEWWPPCSTAHAEQRYRELHPEALPSALTWDLARGRVLERGLVQALLSRYDAGNGGEVFVWGEDHQGIHVVRPMREARGRRFSVWVIVTYIRLQPSQIAILEG